MVENIIKNIVTEKRIFLFCDLYDTISIVNRIWRVQTWHLMV